jgi:hypothetical protein
MYFFEVSPLSILYKVSQESEILATCTFAKVLVIALLQKKVIIDLGPLIVERHAKV